LLFNKERKMQAPVRNIIRYLEKHSAEVK